MEYTEYLPEDTITITLEKGNLDLAAKVEAFLQSLKKTGYVDRPIVLDKGGYENG